MTAGAKAIQELRTGHVFILICSSVVVQCTDLVCLGIILRTGVDILQNMFVWETSHHHLWNVETILKKVLASSSSSIQNKLVYSEVRHLILKSPAPVHRTETANQRIATQVITEAALLHLRAYAMDKALALCAQELEDRERKEDDDAYLRIYTQV